MNLEERVNLSIFTHAGIKTFVRLEFPSLKKDNCGSESCVTNSLARLGLNVLPLD